MNWTCPDCHVPLTPETADTPTSLQRFNLGHDTGDAHVCKECGKRFILWGSGALTAKTAMAVFCLWFAQFLLAMGLFALSILLGLPEMFGYSGRDLPIQDSWAFVAATVIGLGGAALAIYAYPVFVFRQLRLRWRLRSRDRA